MSFTNSMTVLALCALATTSATPTFDVLSLTPHADEEKEPATLRSRQAITLTFSLAAIALGADFGAEDDSIPFTLDPPVPGRFRWVSTTIARFDPSSSWPPELDLTLSLKPGLASYTGVALSSESTQSWTFQTPSLSMRVSRVASATAAALTNNKWSSSFQPLSPGAHEVPPDGEIVLSFGAPVDPARLQQALTLTADAGGAAVALTVRACDGPVARPSCAVVVPAPNALATGALYTLTLPAGSSFNGDGSVTRAPLSAPLSGLVPFTIPFYDWSPTPSYRRHRMWLRHALAPDADLARLAAAFSLSPPLPLALTRPAPDVLQLQANYSGDVKYTLSVAADASIKDGFGLPLLAAELTFTTAALNPFAIQPSRQGYSGSKHARFDPVASEGEPPANWPHLQRGPAPLCRGSWCAPDCCDGLQYSVTNTYDASAVTVLLLALYNPDAIKNDAQGWRIDGATRRTITAPTLDDGQTALTTAAPENFLGAPAGVVVHRRVTSLDYNQDPSNVNAMLISYGSLAAAFVADSVGTITGWVVDTEVVDGRWREGETQPHTDEAPVAGATVQLWGKPSDAWGDDIKERDVQLAATAVTDADGFVTLRPPPASKDLCTKSYSTACTLNDLVAIVTRPWGDGTEEVLVVPDVPEPPSASAASDTHVAELVSDRGLYRPLVIVELKVWVRTRAADGTIRSADAELYDYRFEVDWSSGGETTVVPRTLSAAGGVDATVEVPADAQYGERYVYLRASRDVGGGNGRPPYKSTVYLGSVTVVVGDPRPPTVDLTVAAPEGALMRPGAATRLKLTTATLSGVPVGDAAVSSSGPSPDGRPRPRPTPRVPAGRPPRPQHGDRRRRRRGGRGHRRAGDGGRRHARRCLAA